MDLQTAETMMDNSIKHLESEFSSISVGRASTSMIDGLLVSAYGKSQPIRNISTITTPDPQTIMIQPWDKSVLSDIEKSIRDHSDMGFNPLNDGNVIRITIPHPTEERRKDLLKVVSSKVEDARISVRNVRHKSLSTIHTQKKEKDISDDEAKALENELQELTDKSNAKIDDLSKMKEKEIMTI